MSLAVDHLTVARGHRRVVDDVSLAVAPGEMLGLIGPNGAGKSTVLHAIMGDVAATGDVVFEGRCLADWPRRERACRTAFLAQASPLAFPLAAREIIAMARSPHATGRAVDGRILADVAEAMDVAALLDRPYTRLSGGERQRVQLARVLAQVWPDGGRAPRLLLLDEPVASLDIRHQSRVMQALRRLADNGVAVVVVGHDVSLAAAHVDALIALADGRVVAQGTPGEVVTEATLGEVFGATTHVIAHPVTRTPVVLHG